MFTRVALCQLFAVSLLVAIIQLLTALNCPNLFALVGLMAFRAFGCPFAVVNKIPIQRVGFSFPLVVGGLMACNLGTFERGAHIHYGAPR